MYVWHAAVCSPSSCYPTRKLLVGNECQMGGSNTTSCSPCASSGLFSSPFVLGMLQEYLKHGTDHLRRQTRSNSPLVIQAASMVG